MSKFKSIVIPEELIPYHVEDELKEYGYIKDLEHGFWVKKVNRLKSKQNRKVKQAHND